jgi:hypothetical protein
MISTPRDMTIGTWLKPGCLESSCQRPALLQHQSRCIISLIDLIERGPLCSVQRARPFGFSQQIARPTPAPGCLAVPSTARAPPTRVCVALVLGSRPNTTGRPSSLDPSVYLDLLPANLDLTLPLRARLFLELPCRIRQPLSTGTLSGDCGSSSTPFIFFFPFI